MRTTFNYLAMLLIVLTMGLFTGCSNDDDVSSSDLIGTWTVIHSEGYYKDLLDPKYSEEWNEDIKEEGTVKFNSDGTCVSIDGDDREEATWSLKGDKLSITSTHGGVTITATSAIKLSSSRLIIETSEKNDEYESYEKMTLKKI